MKREPLLNTYSTRHIVVFVLIIALSIALFGFLERFSDGSETVETSDLQAEQGDKKAEN